MRPLRRWLRAFAADTRAATALEFSIVVLPFIIMIFAVFEYALVYLVTVTLDTATYQAARTIRTGEAQAANMTASDFKTMVCSNMGWLQTDCPSYLSVDARVFSSFASSTSPSPVSGGNFDSTQLTFNIGTAGSIVLVTTYYKWELITPALRLGLSRLTGGWDVISARTVFTNEPYAT